MPTLMEHIKRAFLVENEFDNQKKNKNTMFSLEVSEYQDSHAREKNNDF